ncbi:disease resistance protein RUN1-like isoform X2 [Prosopis cineraria]|uniref:disease resistance protein RUN1-like isoform X2 n=1 Tax=Prosopis cineraria TaxID=364024 RepID=UPI00240EA187|nr:disease resistance protein RUN1-like isoform X2 [Prosopis cineraria]
MDDFDHSPSSRPIDLYISFRGVDDFDACKFIYPLFAALKSALEIDGLSAFWDDKKLETANSDIPPHHLRAIQQSCISVVVFSKTFASSVWSLQELSEIAARINDRRHTIIPIFYDVDPSEVRKQKNAYKQAFAEHEERFPADLDQINRWRNAMTQVANLCGWHVPYDPGSSYSKVIDDITTDVKKKMGGVIKSYEGDGIYQVRLLTKEQALQLFCKTAFRRDYPVSGYEDLTNRLLEHTNCHPLAVVILGSFLHKKSVTKWRSALNRLPRIPDNQQIIMDVLKISFDDLDDRTKEIFLDIACFFAGKDINHVKEILQHCGFSVDIGIEVLIEKSFMTISNERIRMHDMLLEMGKEIVQQESPLEPGERSRLWLFDDINHVMQENTASEKVEAIVLNLEDSEGTTLKIEALAQMTNLRVLVLENVNFAGTLTSLSNKLRYVSWHQYPCVSKFEKYELPWLQSFDWDTRFWRSSKSGETRP